MTVISKWKLIVFKVTEMNTKTTSSHPLTQLLMLTSKAKTRKRKMTLKVQLERSLAIGL